MKNNRFQINDSKNEGRGIMSKSFMATVLLVLLIDLAFLFFMGLWAGNVSAQMGGRMPPSMGSERMGGREHPGTMSAPAGQPSDGKMLEMMMDSEHPIWRYLRELTLDEKQKGDIQELRNRLTEEVIRKRTDEQITGLELKNLLEKDPVNIKAAETKIRRIENLRAEMQLSLILAMEELKTKLTPDQRKKLQEKQKTGPRTRERPDGKFDR
jgi:Spy/CpxP family protein refolding chaperone